MRWDLYLAQWLSQEPVGTQAVVEKPIAIIFIDVHFIKLTFGGLDFYP